MSTQARDADDDFEPLFETTAVTDGRSELRLTGKVYADVAPHLRAELERAFERGLKHLVVNAERLEQIDSAGLGVFVELLKRLRPRGGKITFYALSKGVERVFEITKLRKVIDVVATREQALAGAPAPGAGGAPPAGAGGKAGG